MKKLITKIAIVCIVIIILELLIMLGMKIYRELGIDRVNSLYNAIEVDDGYIAVGTSDFYNSKSVKTKTYKYKDQNIIASLARIAKLDEKYNVIWEQSYDTDYDATFYDALAVDDGYIAVGSMVKNEAGIEDNVRDAIIVKYNKNGDIVWDKTYSVLSDTEFYKIIDDGDNNYVVIGQSIYENMELGNHTTGGGIIVRYDQDGEVLAHNNYGGNKSGSFTDIIKVSDGYIVCGKDAVNYGILVKFKKDFDHEEQVNIISEKVMWQRTYSNTDNIGWTSMAMNGDKIYLAGAINVSNEKDAEGNTKFQYDAGIVVYNTSGKYLAKYSIGDSIHHRFNSILISDDKLYLLEILNVDDKDSPRKSVILTYKLDDITKLNNNLLDTKEFDYEHDYMINKLIQFDDQKFIVGTSNNDCNLYGCDYKPIFELYED